MANKPNSWWPDVADVQSAEKASRAGYWAAVFVASVTALVASVALYLHRSVLGIDGFGFVDAVIFAGIAFGIYRMSRVVAVLGLIFYLVERLYAIANASNASASANVMTVILTLQFVHGIRGTFAYHQLTRGAAKSTGAPAPLG